MLKLIINYLIMSLLFFSQYECILNLVDNDSSVYGVLDRFTEDDQVVILIEEIGEELIISKSLLPKDANLHTWFKIKFIGEAEYKLLIDYEKTRIEMQKSQQLLELLRQKQHR